MGLLEELELYFQNTPREQVLKDWKDCEDMDLVGPTIGEFMDHLKEYVKRPDLPLEISSPTFKIKLEPVPAPITITSISVYGETIYIK